MVDMDLSNNLIAGGLPNLRLPKLEKLLLRSNQINSVEGMAGWQLPEISTIDLSANAIGEVTVLRLPSLRQLLLGNNNLGDISPFGHS